MVVVWLCSGVAAVIGFFLTYSDTLKGDSVSKLTEFEASLNDYIREAGRPKTVHGLQLGSPLNLGTIDFDKDYERPSFSFGAEEEEARLVRAVRTLSYHNREIAKAKVTQAIAEYDFAHSSDRAVLRVHSDASLKDLKRDWVRHNTFQAVMKAVGIAAAAAVGAWIMAWLIVVAAALLWWFCIDRLRDISRAVK